MTQDEILAAAKEAGMAVSTCGNGYWDSKADLERFAAIIERRTIERCAYLCDVVKHDYEDGKNMAVICAAAIRKLGEQ